MGVLRLQHPSHQVRHVERRTVGGKVRAEAREDLQEVPLREGGQFAAGLDDGAELTAGEEVDAAVERAALAPCALREATDNAQRASEEAHRLARLAEIPVADAQSLVVDGAHQPVD